MQAVAGKFMLPPNDKYYPKPFYFPVRPGSYRLRSALDNWPEQGICPQHNPQDGRFFQMDTDLTETRAAKVATEHKPQIILDDSTRALHEEVLCWLGRTLREEYHPAALAPAERPALMNELEWYEWYGNQIGEDVVVLQRTAPGRDRVVMEDVRFPSGWNPSLILGQSFQTVHSDVPDFAQCDKRAKAFVDAIVERGPFQRFVWMLATMPDLNVHEEIERPAWPTAEKMYFRVERQCTIPFPKVNGSVFLIRPYTYDVADLSEGQRELLISVLEQTDTKEAAYKGFDVNGPHMLRILRGLK